MAPAPIRSSQWQVVCMLSLPTSRSPSEQFDGRRHPGYWRHAHDLGRRDATQLCLGERRRHRRHGAGNLKASGSCSISSNTASDGGGGIYDTGDGTVTVSGSKLKFNTANNGGGIYMASGTLTIVGGTISLNKASTQGGGIFDNSATIKISGGTSFASNSTPRLLTAEVRFMNMATPSQSAIARTGNRAEYGGGVFVFGGSLKISDSVFSKDPAVEGGAIDAIQYTVGAIVIEPNAAVPADVFISDSCTFTSNSATGDGAQIVAQRHSRSRSPAATSPTIRQALRAAASMSTMAMSRSHSARCPTIRRLRRRRDLRLWRQGRDQRQLQPDQQLGDHVERQWRRYPREQGNASVTITDSTVSLNSAEYGGGVSVRAGSLTIALSLFSGNEATIWGGGVVGTSTANVLIESSCSFSGNTAGTSGGAIYISDNCTFSMNGSTVANNTSDYGGGIFVQSSSVTVAGAPCRATTRCSTAAVSF